MNLAYTMYTLLHSDADVESVVGTNIYPDIIKRHSTLPAITYTLDNVLPTDTKDSSTKWDEIFVSVTIHGLTRYSLEELAWYVRIAMDRKYGVKGTDTVITTNYQGESWDFLEDGTRPEDERKRQGLCITTMNFRIVITDDSGYAPGSGSTPTSFIRKADTTQTLTAGSNTLTHSKGLKLRSLIVANSADTINYFPNWINVDENEATIEWVAATLTSAKIKYSY